MPDPKDLWYKNAIIYGVDVGLFQDADGDGVGDLEGLIDRLGYIESLGVNCIWLMPIVQTPGRDNGYDVSDYLALDPDVGDFGQLAEFVALAADRGIRVIFDLVLNHSSNEHPWFLKAREEPDSREHGFYIWADEPAPPLDGRGPIFPGEEDSVWAKDEVSGRWYYHRFYHFQPDLNHENGELRKEIERILRFWLQLGASGFRIDAASHMVEPKGRPGAEIEAGHAVLKELRAFADRTAVGTLLIGEADEGADSLGSFFGEGDELHALLNFLMNNYLFLALARGEAEPIRFALELLPKIPSTSHWINFLRNLDELDLERLSGEQRQEVFEAFAPDEDMRIFGRGIRRRIAPMLGNYQARLKMAYSLLFALPGSPVIIYGDEIGMGDDLSLKGRSAVRVPMQWSADREYGGFSSATPVRKPVAKGEFGFPTVNVEQQDHDPQSLLNWIRQLARLRRRHRKVGGAAPQMIDTQNRNVVGIGYAADDEVLVTLHNLGKRKAELQVALPKAWATRGRVVHSSAANSGESIDLAAPLQLEGYGALWIETRVETE